MSQYLVRQFWIDTAERVVRTAAQAAAGSITATALVQEIDWTIVGGTTGTASLLAFLFCLGAPAKAQTGNASFVDNGTLRD